MGEHGLGDLDFAAHSLCVWVCVFVDLSGPASAFRRWNYIAHLCRVVVNIGESVPSMC